MTDSGVCSVRLILREGGVITTGALQHRLLHIVPIMPLDSGSFEDLFCDKRCRVCTACDDETKRQEQEAA